MIPRPTRSFFGEIPAGAAGARVTMGLMMREIARGSIDPSVRPVALHIVADARERDHADIARRVYHWVIDHMSFRNDNFGVETLQSPAYMLQQIEANGRAYGDCDDFVILIGTLLKVLGYAVKIRVIRYEGLKEFSHVILAVMIRGRGWAELDGTVRSGEPLSVPRAELMDSPVIQ